jgi:hypothetical protein
MYNMFMLYAVVFCYYSQTCIQQYTVISWYNLLSNLIGYVQSNIIKLYFDHLLDKGKVTIILLTVYLRPVNSDRQFQFVIIHILLLPELN